MPKPSNREKLLTAGLRVIKERGFSGASVRDIAQAAGAPLGSFTSHFESKEAFNLEVLNCYYAAAKAMAQAILSDSSLNPLDRLQAYLNAATSTIGDSGTWSGCLIGNFCAEACEHSETIRERLVEITCEMQQQIAECLDAAAAAGELPDGTNSRDLAAFILAALQGAILQSKAERSLEPINGFKRVLFSTILVGHTY